MGRLAVLLMVGFCFAVAGSTYYLAFHQPAQTMQRAETVQGTIDSTDIVVQSGDTSSGYAPVVRYEYSYRGETYTSDQYSLVGGAPAGSRSTVSDFLDQYTAGQTVTVYVDPQDPSNSFLTRGSVGLPFYGAIGFFVFVGGLSLVALVADLLGVEAVTIH